MRSLYVVQSQKAGAEPEHHGIAALQRLQQPSREMYKLLQEQAQEDQQRTAGLQLGTSSGLEETAESHEQSGMSSM